MAEHHLLRLAGVRDPSVDFSTDIPVEFLPPNSFNGTLVSYPLSSSKVFVFIDLRSSSGDKTANAAASCRMGMTLYKQVPLLTFES